MHALLIGNGEKPSAKLLRALAAQADFIVAADGGANIAFSSAITPDLIIGDLDSVSAAVRQKLSPEKFLLVKNQNNTDLEKALIYLQNRGCKKCILTGFSGGRWDFSIGNLLALTRFAQKMDLKIAADNWTGYVLTGPKRFTHSKGIRVSLIALKTCTGVTLSGLKFPLKNTRLTVGMTRSLSNQTTGKTFSVSFTHGQLLVYVEEPLFNIPNEPVL